MKLHTLLSSLPFYKSDDNQNPTITSIENDNRLIQQGSLFVCVKGYTVDGHDFAADAVSRGAAAVIAQRPLDLPVPVIIVKDSVRAMAVLGDYFYNHPTQKLTLIGILGPIPDNNEVLYAIPNGIRNTIPFLPYINSVFL